MNIYNIMFHWLPNKLCMRVQWGKGWKIAPTPRVCTEFIPTKTCFYNLQLGLDAEWWTASEACRSKAKIEHILQNSEVRRLAVAKLGYSFICLTVIWLGSPTIIRSDAGQNERRFPYDRVVSNSNLDRDNVTYHRVVNDNVFIRFHACINQSQLRKCQRNGRTTKDLEYFISWAGDGNIPHSKECKPVKYDVGLT